MMIKVLFVKPPVRKEIIVDSATTTIKELLQKSEVDYKRFPPSLDGATLGPDDYNKTLTEYGVTTEKCVIDFSKKMDGLFK